MKPVCYLIGAGVFSGAAPRLRAGDFLIAADAGLRTARSLGFSPDLVVGDFDSLGEVPEGTETIRLPVEKDETDTAAAFREGERRGYTRFVLLGCTGGRPDHTFANQQLLVGLAGRGLDGCLVGDGYAVYALRNGGMRFPAGRRGTISVFAAAGPALGVTEAGLKYPLSDATLLPGVPLGVSNSFTGEPASVSVRDGTLLIFVEGGEPFSDGFERFLL